MIKLTESREPKIGCFFYINGEVYADTISLKDYMWGIKDYKIHGELWNELQRMYPELNLDKQNKYKVPRGKIMPGEYGGYNLEMDDKLNKPEIIKQIADAFDIPVKQIIYMGNNYNHYNIEDA